MIQGLQQFAGGFKANQHGQMCACNHCGIRFGRAAEVKAPEEKTAPTAPVGTAETTGDTFTVKPGEKLTDEQLAVFDKGIAELIAKLSGVKEKSAALGQEAKELETKPQS